MFRTLLLFFSSAALVLGTATLWANSDPAGPLTGLTTTDSGPVYGKQTATSGVIAYLGIPYAAPVTGANRWTEPQPVARWTTPRACVQFGQNTLQEAQHPFQMFTEEFIPDPSLGYGDDSLSLNVWTSGPVAARKPVIVFIHGGAFMGGSSSVEVYSGEQLAAQGVVFVSINYRVGANGFLALPELSAGSSHHVSGNYGILDQVFALKWVQRNIAHFGGDPGNVTIMGQSAGGMAINYLMSTPMAQGLFHKAVSMSGINVVNPKLPLAVAKEPSTLAAVEKQNAEGLKKFCQEKGIVIKTAEDLRKMSPELLTELTKYIVNDAVIDGYVFPDTQLKLLVNHKTSPVPLLVGNVQGDADNPFLFEHFHESTFGGPSTTAAFQKAVEEDFGPWASSLLTLYTPKTNAEVDQIIHEVNLDYLRSLDYLVASQRARGPSTKTFLYWYDYPMPGPDGGRFGAFHTSEVPYFLDFFTVRRQAFWTDKDLAFGKTLSAYLVNFAAHGDPNGPGLAAWLPFTGQPTFQGLGQEIKPVAMAADKAKFWTEFVTAEFAR